MATKKARTRARAKTKTTRGTRRDTRPKTDEQKAHVWVLFEEGLSQREIARQTRFHPRTIQRILTQDRGRLAALAALQADERRAIWKRIENRALHEIKGWIQASHAAAFKGEGFDRKDSLSDLDKAYLAYAPRVGSWLTRIACGAASQVQLGSGLPTERVAHTGGLALDVMSATDEELIEEAKKLGLIPLLPARLLEKLGAKA